MTGFSEIELTVRSQWIWLVGSENDKRERERVDCMPQLMQDVWSLNKHDTDPIGWRHSVQFSYHVHNCDFKILNNHYKLVSFCIQKMQNNDIKPPCLICQPFFREHDSVPKMCIFPVVESVLIFKCQLQWAVKMTSGQWIVSEKSANFVSLVLC